MKKTCGCLNHQPRQFLQLSVATVTSWSCWNLKYSISQQRWAYKAEWADRRNRTFACCHTACLIPDQEASIGLILDTMVMLYFMVLIITMPKIMLATLQMRCQGNWRGEISGWAALVLGSLRSTCACQHRHGWLFCFCMQCTDLWLGIPRGVAKARGGCVHLAIWLQALLKCSLRCTYFSEVESKSCLRNSLLLCWC